MPFAIEKLPPAGPMTFVAVASVTGFVQSNPVTVASVFDTLEVTVSERALAGARAVAVGADGASPQAAASATSATPAAGASRGIFRLGRPMKALRAPLRENTSSSRDEGGMS